MFSLISIIISLAMIAVIFVAVVLPRFFPDINPFSKETGEQLPQSPLDAAHDVKRQNDLAHLSSALANYAAQFGGYPSTGGALINIQGSDAGNQTPCRELASIAVSCPLDPDPSRSYGYRSDGAHYELTALLQDPSCSAGGAAKEGDLCLLRITTY